MARPAPEEEQSLAVQGWRPATCKGAFQKRTWVSWWAPSWTWASRVLQQRRTAVPCAVLSNASRTKEGDPSFQLSTSDGTSEGLCLLLDSPVQERCGVSGNSAANGHEDVSGIGASSVRGEADRAGTVHINVYRYLTRRGQNKMDTLSTGVQWQDKSQGHKLQCRKFHLNTWKIPRINPLLLLWV